ncbi:MAG: signal peptidase II [Caldilineaceae bacterium]
MGDYLVFERVRNYGAAFGILQNQSSLFAIIAVVVGVAILVYVYQLPPEQKSWCAFYWGCNWAAPWAT